MSTNVLSAVEPRLGREVRLINLPRQPMVVLAAAGILGIVSDRVLGIETEHWLLLIAAAMTVLAVAWIWEPLRLIAMMSLCAAVFGFHHHQQYNDYKSDTLAGFLTDEWKPILIEAIVRSPIERRPDTLADQRSDSEFPAWQSLFVVEAVAVRDGYDFRSASGRARVVVKGEVEGLLYGDRVRLSCSGQRIPPPSNPGEVNLQRIYRANRELVRLHANLPEHVKLIRRGDWSVRRIIDWIGNRGHQAIIANMQADSAPLAEALVLGRRQAVDRKLRDRLLESGTIHLLAVSGLHVGIVALAVTWLAMWIGLSRTACLFTIIGVCLAYMLVTGARPPVMRAATLISIFLLGRLFGKRVDPLNSLATAAVLLMLIDPSSMGQVGTHLSFLAVTTIVLAGSRPETPAQIDPIDLLLNSRWARFAVRCRNALAGLKQLVSISFWIWCIGLPLVWYHFHIIAPVSIIANVLLWVPLTVALISGLVTAVAGGIWLPLGSLSGRLCELSLQSIVALVEAVTQIKGAYYWMPAPPLSMVLLFYIVVAVLPLVVAKPFRKKAVAAFMALWIAAAAVSATRSAHQERFAATFIDVGHGTSVLLQFPNGEQWLYDAGRLGDPAFARWPIESVLWSAGVRHLDGIIVSHADADHYNAIVGLVERFSVSKVVGSHELFPNTQQGIIELQQTLAARRIAVHKLAAGDVLLQTPDLRVESLHPPRKPVQGSDNDNSIVLRIDCYGQTVVLPGDVESHGTAMLIAQTKPEPRGVLMAPHHGSMSQDVFPILQWADPAVVIASGGKRAADPRVLQSLAETGADTYVTSRDGAIRVIIDRNTIEVRTWRDDPW